MTDRSEPIPPEEMLVIGYRLAMRHGGQKADQNDAAQEFCLGAVRRRAEGYEADRPGDYEYASGANAQRRNGRRRQRYNAREQQFNGHERAEAVDPAAALTQVETATAVERALACLTIRQRAVVVLFFGFRGVRPHTCSEIASLAHVTKQNIHDLRKRALRRLENTLRGTPVYPF